MTLKKYVVNFSMSMLKIHEIYSIILKRYPPKRAYVSYQLFKKRFFVVVNYHVDSGGLNEQITSLKKYIIWKINK